MKFEADHLSSLASFWNSKRTKNSEKFGSREPFSFCGYESRRKIYDGREGVVKRYVEGTSLLFKWQKGNFSENAIRKLHLIRIKQIFIPEKLIYVALENCCLKNKNCVKKLKFVNNTIVDDKLKRRE